MRISGTEPSSVNLSQTCCIKTDRNCSFVGLLHNLFWFQLVFALLGHLFSTLETTFWLRITDKGSVPEMLMWTILLISFDLKWCIHQFFCILH